MILVWEEERNMTGMTSLGRRQTFWLNFLPVCHLSLESVYENKKILFQEDTIQEDAIQEDAIQEEEWKEWRKWWARDRISSSEWSAKWHSIPLLQGSKLLQDKRSRKQPGSRLFLTWMCCCIHWTTRGRSCLFVVVLESRCSNLFSWTALSLARVSMPSSLCIMFS